MSIFVDRGVGLVFVPPRTKSRPSLGRTAVWADCGHAVWASEKARRRLVEDVDVIALCVPCCEALLAEYGDDDSTPIVCDELPAGWLDDGLWGVL
jgi:hypothetical protein